MIGQCIFPAMLFNIETDFMQNMFIYLHCKKKKREMLLVIFHHNIIC